MGNSLQMEKRVGSEVTLLYSENLEASELNAMKIVKFLGGTTRLVRLTEELARNRESLRSAVSGCAALIINAQTLAKLSCDNRGGVGSNQLVSGLAPSVLVYGFERTPNDAQLLRALTADSLAGVEQSSSAGERISVAADVRNVCRQFSGVDFEALGPDRHFTFVKGDRHKTYSQLISLGTKPFFVQMKDADCQLLLLANATIADLDERVPHSTSLLQYFPSLVPVMMFLHSASNNGFWHSDAPSACFIVDDPLLKRRYGFLDYEKLLGQMERKQFCTSIAFIPWNFSKSDRELADQFAAHPNRYSLCVHGCDHTWGEFGSTDLGLLQDKAQQSLERMEQHRKLSGVDFDDIMVFPQGIFSTTAMKALKAGGYLAAVNTTPCPIDESDSVSLGQLLQVAVTQFSNFPLFTRRYPQELAALAFDLFLGKPALVVEHHNFFKDGYDALAQTVEKLYRLDERLHWANLGTICSRACLKRIANDGEIQVQFFTDRFSLRNQTDRAQNYVLIRQVLQDEEVSTFNISGFQVNVQREDGLVKARLSLAAGEATEIEIEREPAEHRPVARRTDRMHQAKVFVRRTLTEFRDNYVDTNPFLNRSSRNR